VVVLGHSNARRGEDYSQFQPLWKRESLRPRTGALQKERDCVLVAVRKHHQSQARDIYYYASDLS